MTLKKASNKQNVLHVNTSYATFEFSKINLTLRQQNTEFNFYFDRNSPLEKNMVVASDPVTTSMDTTLHLRYQVHFLDQINFLD